jgi:hypothetical protein
MGASGWGRRGRSALTVFFEELWVVFCSVSLKRERERERERLKMSKKKKKILKTAMDDQPLLSTVFTLTYLLPVVGGGDICERVVHV